MNKLFLNHFSFLQNFNIKTAVTLEQLQLLEQTNTQTNIAATKLKWPRGRFSEKLLFTFKVDVSSGPQWSKHCIASALQYKKLGRDKMTLEPANPSISLLPALSSYH